MLICGFRRLVGQSQQWWVEVVDGSQRGSLLLFFFLFLVYGCEFCDQRRARMVFTDLGGVAGFSIGLGVKNSWGAWGYIQIAGVSLGLFKISKGKNLKGTIIFGWLALLMVFLLSGCLRLCCMDRIPDSDTENDVGQPHYFNVAIKQQ